LIRLFETADQSTSLFHEELQETYHSKHGAFSESMHVFIENGLRFLAPSSKPVRILEVGFGTGLNASLVYQEVFGNQSLKVNYTGLEPFPLPDEILAQVRFDGLDKDVFKKVHDAYNQPVELAEGRFTCRVFKQGLEDFQADELFDLVFYDAFGPAVQPELWGRDALAKTIAMMSPAAVWVSYCAKGEVRRILTSEGLKVSRLPGPAFKRHMLRAVKPQGACE
jgi:tRNA U34 5-methylaminomethyl-2-thiouridine-forming methyltransferase MnmC